MFTNQELVQFKKSLVQKMKNLLKKFLCLLHNKCLVTQKTKTREQ